MARDSFFIPILAVALAIGVGAGDAFAGDWVFDYNRGTYTEIGSDNSFTTGNQVRYFDYDSGTNQSYQVETWQRSDPSGFGARIYDPQSHEYRQLEELK
ncbi:MAG: DUF5334 family protein [Gammaproteobacteria bacterium]|nr:DUF5334 family protein [Gammaproteobacteria bacterium]